MLKKIFINILLITFFVILIEIMCYFITADEINHIMQNVTKVSANNKDTYKVKYKLLEDFSYSFFRESYIKENSKKKPILWLGCSFAEGAGLDKHQTPCYKISQLTGRSCINRSKGATGTQFIYYQLNNENFFKEAPEAEYIIYVFIWNHLKRLYNVQLNPLIDMFNLRYKLDKDKLVEIKPTFKPIYSSFFIKRLLNQRVNKVVLQEAVDFKLFNTLMKESIKITKEKYPNSKFIILEYPDISERKYFPDYEIKELESYGITVVRVTDLIKDKNIYENKYWLPDNIHPTEEAWDMILPKFYEQYLK